MKTLTPSLPAIPETYQGAFPEGFALAPRGWALPEEIVLRGEIEVAAPGRGTRTVRPIAQMDVEFLDDRLIGKAQEGTLDLVRNYQCKLACPGCFSEDSVYANPGRLLRWREVVAQLREATKFGLRSIKFLGHGDPLQNPDMLDIIGAVGDLGLQFGLFTKGVELGSDDEARKVFGHRGIRSGDDLARMIARDFPHVNIYLGFNSMYRERQDLSVGSTKHTRPYEERDGAIVHRGVPGYTDVRNLALERLVRYGMNDPSQGQRLSLIASPLSPPTYQADEMPELFEWAARRNMPLVMAPSMPTGKGDGLVRLHLRDKERYDASLADLYVGVYERAMGIGVLSAQRILSEGLSAYAATAPCSQISTGLHMRLDGSVKMCPAAVLDGAPDGPGSSYGNVHEIPLLDIWTGSWSYRSVAPSMNNWCQAKTRTLTGDLQDEVLSRLGLG